jgi:hypothetical protein
MEPCLIEGDNVGLDAGALLGYVVVVAAAVPLADAHQSLLSDKTPEIKLLENTSRQLTDTRLSL